MSLDLLFLDFAEEYQKHPEQALYALQALLLDQASVRGRVAFLHELGALSETDLPDVAPERERSDFTEEIRLIREIGTIRAVEEHKLDPQRLAALICDPEALWRAHRALVSEDEGVEPTPAPTTPVTARSETSPETTPGTFTNLAVGGRWPELADRLRPYLPEVLQAVGLDVALAGPLLKFIQEQARSTTLQGRHFRQLLPVWLNEFAAAHGKEMARPLRQEEWEAILRPIVERTASRIILEEEPAGQPSWAREFRRIALERRAGSLQDLLLIELPEESVPALALGSFRRDLATRIDRKRETALRLFELN
jgi:hypothetical protein